MAYNMGSPHDDHPAFIHVARRWKCEAGTVLVALYRTDHPDYFGGLRAEVYDDDTGDLIEDRAVNSVSEARSYYPHPTYGAYHRDLDDVLDNRVREVVKALRKDKTLTTMEQVDVLAVREMNDKNRTTVLRALAALKAAIAKITPKGT